MNGIIAIIVVVLAIAIALMLALSREAFSRAVAITLARPRESFSRARNGGAHGTTDIADGAAPHCDETTARSRTEARVIALVEAATGERFDTAHPAWLRDPATGARLELDGYNEKLRVAVEVQGPGHIKPIPGESYEKYIARVERDELKQRICAARGVHLITVDYRITGQGALDAYIRSRLYDARAIARPSDYIYPYDMTPWRRDQ